MTFLSTTRSSASLRNRTHTSFIDLLSLYRQRRALSRLDTRALQDIGVTAKDAEKEALRGFWDVPDHWVK